MTEQADTRAWQSSPEWRSVGRDLPLLRGADGVLNLNVIGERAVAADRAHLLDALARKQVGVSFSNGATVSAVTWDDIKEVFGD